VLVPVLCGAAAAYLTRQRIERMPVARVLGHWGSGRWGGGRLTLVVLGSAVFAGAVLGLLAWWSAGAVGPGRLQHAGPNPLFVAGAVAAEVLVGGAIGIAVRRHADEPGSVSRPVVSSPSLAVPPTAGLSSPISTPTASLRERRLQERARDGRAAESVTRVVAPATPVRGTSPVDEAVTAEIPVVPERKGARKVRGRDEPESPRSEPKAEPTARPSAGRALPARPNAPRVPSPRGRVPALRAHQDFGPPDFARHEGSDDDHQQ
jgi:hypothetical protein